METSKKIILASYILGFLLTVLTVLGAVFGYDVTALSVITGAAFGEISVSNAFYFSKAKKENLLKIAAGAAKDTDSAKVDDVVKIITALGGIV